MSDPRNRPDYNPAAEYLSVRKDLSEYSKMGQRMPQAEANKAFATLMYACEALIRQNESLMQEVVTAKGLLDDKDIEICLKDLEIFNFTNHQEKKD